ncbi:type VII secretion target [Streptomyces tsukubensis]|uniref:Excreted virulence factor EspC (Type VII ESX diderm) n=1 Tax=Streptomyces tsukubensis TaxID=83656 RepID=A0A1V4A8X9_9ACTN|nr:type VII secretion target [Streptomyces tsukubensis]OON78468.1 hypothetical protein B1H18_17030 [Streptomyces tsukubensis]QFR95231.1 hypothetical protein GBW32_22195 [Streptomyces tsukubensis]
MAQRLAVDGGELEHFVTLLKRSGESLRGLRRALGAATVTGLGTDDLDVACAEFQADWKTGTEQIGEQTEDLAKIVAQSRESYLEVDRALAEALGEGAGGGSS